MIFFFTVHHEAIQRSATNGILRFDKINLNEISSITALTLYKLNDFAEKIFNVYWYFMMFSEKNNSTQAIEIKEHKNWHISIHAQGHSCRCPGSLCRQGISWYGLDLIYKVHSELIMRRLQSTMKTELYARMKEDKNGRYYVNRGLSSSNCHTGRYFRCLGFGLTQWPLINMTANIPTTKNVFQSISNKEIYSVVFLSKLIYKLSMLCLRTAVWYYHSVWDHRLQGLRGPNKMVSPDFFFKCFNIFW